MAVSESAFIVGERDDETWERVVQKYLESHVYEFHFSSNSSRYKMYHVDLSVN